MATAAAPKMEFHLKSDSWLASILGRPAARLSFGGRQLPASAELSAAIKQRRWLSDQTPDSGKCFVDCKFDSLRVDLVGLLSEIGMRVVDVNVTSELSGAAIKSLDIRATRNNHIIFSSETNAAQQAELLEIASSAFRYSRFHLDPQLDNSLANRIKREWVNNGLTGKRADAMWVSLDQNGRANGFLTSLIVPNDAEAGDSSVAIIDLIGVASDAQGQGVGRALTMAFVEHYLEREIRTFRVGTQVANMAAQRLYQSIGFRPTSSAYVMHGHY